MARKILLADDSVTAQNMGRKILADAGYEVITVNNGSAALKKIAEHKPDLIVLDVYMPGYSGLEVCQRLKESQETARVPVLLSVGKLEPFKPEEAKRVRADGFIVKPFEASELLSALSKLEDKIVPRSETSKPGRLARANAALDDGRYDKTVAIEEDSGWKNRIAFPSKKKKPVQEDGDDPAIYNAINKDLRTVIETKAAEHPFAVNEQEARVDLGALAPEGFPKDVTPEEIAALAAAAAQVKGKIADTMIADPEPAKAPEKANDEPKPEAVQPLERVVELPQEVPVAAAPEPAHQAVPTLDEVTAAIVGLEANSAASPSAGSGNGSWTHAADEPVTMAAAAGTGAVGPGTRWTAVSMALDPDEAAISLEHEMQKAYAAFAAAESGHAGLETPVPETQPFSVEPPAPTETSTVHEPLSSASVPVPAIPAPDATQSLIAVASAATEAVSAVVQELGTLAESHVERKEPASAAPASVDESATHPTAEVKAEETPVASAAEPKSEAHFLETEKSEAPAIAQEELKASEPPVAAATDSLKEESGMTQGVVENESDMAETTAAAWATWHQNRESGDTRAASAEPSHNEIEPSSIPVDASAMAVAAGAEKAPEETFTESESDPAAIASIVDSVLADLRPKIFEEISRKMGKKK